MIINDNVFKIICEYKIGVVAMTLTGYIFVSKVAVAIYW